MLAYQRVRGNLQESLRILGENHGFRQIETRNPSIETKKTLQTMAWYDQQPKNQGWRYNNYNDDIICMYVYIYV